MEEGVRRQYHGHAMGTTTLPQLVCDEVDVQTELPWKGLIQPSVLETRTFPQFHRKIYELQRACFPYCLEKAW
jgi:hypothetical protein